jgi:hypothetical protein
MPQDSQTLPDGVGSITRKGALVKELQSKPECATLRDNVGDPDNRGETMSTTIDYRQRLLDEISGLSP